MELLLIRHAQAVEGTAGRDDGARWLTAKGRKATRKIARWIAKRSKRRPAAIWTSPLVRAVQTAEIVAAAARVKGEVEAVAELGPGRDPGDLVKRLAASCEATGGPLALVGHEPSLSILAATLLGADVPGGFKKSGVLGITWSEGAGELRFRRDPAEKKVEKKAKRPSEPKDSAAPPSK